MDSPAPETAPCVIGEPPPLPRPSLTIRQAFILMALSPLLLTGFGRLLVFLINRFEPLRRVGEYRHIIAMFASASLVLLLGRAMTGMSWRSILPLTKFNGWILLPLAIALAGIQILGSEIGNAVRWVAPPPRIFAHWGKSLHAAPMIYLIRLLLVGPLTEEAVSRGLVLGGLLNRYRARTAILISALIFMLAHLNPYQFVGAFTFGLLAGWAYLHTRSLLPCVIAHVVMNLSSALIVIGAIPRVIPGFSLPHDPKVVLFHPLWFDALGLALTGLGLWWLYRRFHRPEPVSLRENA